MYIVIEGDPVGGFKYIGPFATVDDAIDYIDADSTREMWSTKLIKPEEG
jgi:hypothetical protein